MYEMSHLSEHESLCRALLTLPTTNPGFQGSPCFGSALHCALFRCVPSQQISFCVFPMCCFFFFSSFFLISSASTHYWKKGHSVILNTPRLITPMPSIERLSLGGSGFWYGANRVPSRRPADPSRYSPTSLRCSQQPWAFLQGGDEAQPIHVTRGQRGFQSSSRRGQSHENNTHFVNTELRAAAVGL